MQEIWKDIANYEGRYQVSNLGRVKTQSGIIRRTKRNNRGYVQISLSKNGHDSYFLLHRLVAQSFISNPNNFPQVNHKDEDKSNNMAENLEWCTNAYNRHYGTGICRMASHHDYQELSKINSQKESTGRVNQFDLKRNLIHVWESATAAEKITGHSHGAILRCCRKELNQSCGFVWRFEESA